MNDRSKIELSATQSSENFPTQQGQRAARTEAVSTRSSRRASEQRERERERETETDRGARGLFWLGVRHLFRDACYDRVRGGCDCMTSCRGFDFSVGACLAPFRG